MRGKRKKWRSDGPRTSCCAMVASAESGPLEDGNPHILVLARKALPTNSLLAICGTYRYHSKSKSKEVANLLDFPVTTQVKRRLCLRVSRQGDGKTKESRDSNKKTKLTRAEQAHTKEGPYDRKKETGKARKSIWKKKEGKRGCCGDRSAGTPAVLRRCRLGPLRRVPPQIPKELWLRTCSLLYL